ncbi:MAG: YihY/virulence factor BrkB family protein [Nitrospiraceae bacterium]|nr:YihY/virulence factor BrkB family protein [Nitrospiraceae bacterium]
MYAVLRSLRPATLWPLLKEAASDWSHDRAPRLGAALAYYTVFSIVPLLIIIIAVIGLVFGQDAAQGAIMQHIASLVGEQSAATLKDMIQRADEPSTGILATIIAVGTALLGASGFFGELQSALNTVWGLQPKEGLGIWGYIRSRFLSMATVLGTAFLLLVSLLLTAAVSSVGKWFGGLLPLPELVLQAINVLLSFIVITGLFAMIFKVLPDAHVAWRDVWVGAALTAALFTVGKFAIGLYLGKSNPGSGYGAAGSLVILLVWVYYSAQILLYGAEFTQVYANRRGGQIVPTKEADIIDPKKATPPDQLASKAARPEQSGDGEWAHVKQAFPPVRSKAVHRQTQQRTTDIEDDLRQILVTRVALSEKIGLLEQRVDETVVRTKMAAHDVMVQVKDTGARVVHLTAAQFKPAVLAAQRPWLLVGMVVSAGLVAGWLYKRNPSNQGSGSPGAKPLRRRPGRRDTERQAA